MNELTRVRLASEATNSEDKFSSHLGLMAKPSLDGSFGSYTTLKYFAMPKTLKLLVKDSVEDIEDNVETYFLRFSEGQKLPMIKSIDSCLFTCKSVLLSGEAEVTYKSEVFDMVPGDEIEIEPRYAHQVIPKSPCMFLVELQMRKF